MGQETGGLKALLPAYTLTGAEPIDKNTEHNAQSEHERAELAESSRILRSEHVDESADADFLQGDRQAERQKRLKEAKKRKPNFITRLLNQWFNRLFGAISERSLSDQEEMYTSHRTKRDYVWNTLGVASWGMVFPLLTIVVTQLVGVEQAGMFSLAFVVGLLIMFIGNYGVRAYQVSDTSEEHSFTDYQVNRIATCVIMLVVGVLYCVLRGYDEGMFLISMGVYFYKMIDGLADVYEGRLQQKDKLYLAGISQTVRSVFVVVVFSLCLLITRNLAVSCIVMAVAALITFVLVTLPLALMETPKSKSFSQLSVFSIFKQCFPLFIAIFMFNLVDNMPRFVMEGVLTYDNQLYFNALYFPAQAILIAMQLVYKPQIIRMSDLWVNPDKRKKFDLMMVLMLVGIIVVTVVVMLFMGWIGIPIMSFLYGIDFEPFRGLCYIMLIAGGVTAGIDFLYQAITVQRRQMAVMKLYVITFFFSLFIPALLVNFTGLPGIIISYLIIMSILFVLLLVEYASIRFAFVKEGQSEQVLDMQSKRPSEIRAERERLKQHRGSGVHKDSDKKRR